MGLPETQAPKIEIRTKLLIGIKRAIEKRKLTHAKAASVTGVGRTVITAIMNGNLNRISTDRLIDIAQQLGLNLDLKVA